MSPPGVNVLGYLREAKGIGEAARLHAAALRAAGVPVRTGALHAGGTATVEEGHVGAGELRTSREHPVSLFCMNAPELGHLLEHGGRLPATGRRIGAWAWEVDPLPAEWSAVAEQLDEIWVPSRWVAEVVGRGVSVPVVAIPHPVVAPAAESVPAPKGPFTFLFSFDFHSTPMRKNPLGLIEAYRIAFDAGAPTRLVIKSINGAERPGELDELVRAAAGREDIEVRDGFVDRDERDAILAACHCYVSLHRAEGFGLTIAEAMAVGRPAIATGFGGNTDFMPPGTGHLVAFRNTPVGEEAQRVYPAGSWWAEPDPEHAVELMRAVAADPQGAARTGARARAHVRERFSPEVVGAIARRRLELTGARRAGPLARLRGR